MKTRINSPLLLIAGLALSGLQTSFAAQPFDSGSDGSYGAMNITGNTTLDLPPDGIFHCTTITVAFGATLRFNRNALNTPVWLLATGDVTISVAGTIDVSGGGASGRLPGVGGPGGFDGGEGGYGGTGFGGTGTGADGKGPGGGMNSGSPQNYQGRYTGVYGNALLVPLIGGSGGSGYNGNPGEGGGGAGGAILLASTTRVTLNGVISANGGNGNGGGSGGAIRIVAPVVTGTGQIQAVGGGSRAWGLDAGQGRVRIDSLDSYLPRSLIVYRASSSRGAQMFVFPAVQPRLDIIEVAGQAIPFPATNGVSIALPLGADTTQIVKVRASGFTNDVAITVTVVPTDRASSTSLAVISMTNNPVVISVPVTLAADSTNRIYVWTR